MIYPNCKREAHNTIRSFGVGITLMALMFSAIACSTGEKDRDIQATVDAAVAGTEQAKASIQTAIDASVDATLQARTAAGSTDTSVPLADTSTPAPPTNTPVPSANVTPTSPPTAASPTPVSSQRTALSAFPGAQGFGAPATGGRGGDVLKVTNLNTSGEGSLQWALDQPGPRIIVFGVSGVIEGDVRIPHGDVTIAGQTAPGAGITIHGHLYTEYCTTFGNIVIRHVRVRSPMPDDDWPAEQHDAIQFSCNHSIILDHVDVSHGVDENVDMWGGATDITVQWSTITFPVHKGGHPKGEHNYGLINGPGGGRISIHHNLFVHNGRRTPALAWGPAEVRNNVVYNGREGFNHNNPAVGDFNIVGNYYKDGPSASLAPLWFDPEDCDTVDTRYWLWNNWVDDPGVFTGQVDNPFDAIATGFDYYFYNECLDATFFNQSGEFDFSSHSGYVPVSTDDPLVAYENVLDHAGAWPRDIVNTWAVDETRNRTGAWGNRRPADWLEGLTPGTPPTDSDDDGMPDTWETSHGLNKNDGSDHNTVMPSGYTAIEVYINELADSLTPGE